MGSGYFDAYMIGFGAALSRTNAETNGVCATRGVSLVFCFFVSFVFLPLSSGFLWKAENRSCMST